MSQYHRSRSASYATRVAGDVDPLKAEPLKPQFVSQTMQSMPKLSQRSLGVAG